MKKYIWVLGVDGLHFAWLIGIYNIYLNQSQKQQYPFWIKGNENIIIWDPLVTT